MKLSSKQIKKIAVDTWYRARARVRYHVRSLTCRLKPSTISRFASPKLLIGVAICVVILLAVQIWAGIFLSQRAFTISESLTHRDIARTFADRLRAIGRGTKAPEVYRHVQELAALNPAVRLYLLDEHGIVKASPESYGKIQLPFVDIRPIRRFVSRSSTSEMVYGDDPHELRNTKPISAASVTIAGLPHFVYVVLGDPGPHGQLPSSLGISLGIGSILFTLTIVTLLGGVAGYIMYRRLYGINASLAAISHDLRGPLSSVQGYLETLLERGDRLNKDDSQKYMSVALKSTQSAATMVNDIHHLSVLETSADTIEKEPFSCSDLIMDIIMSSKQRYDEKGVSILSDVSQEMPWVSGNVPLIERLIRNLVDNALRYTEKGGRVQVTAYQVANKVRVMISDTGCGIPTAELGKVQQEFFRGEKTRSSTAGSGIGLTIARRVAALHGSELKLLSKENEGTVVSFELAIHQSLSTRKRSMA